MIECLHHADHGKFRSRIIAHVTEAKQTRRTGHTYNVTMISAQHRRQKLLQDPVTSKQIYPQRRNEFLLFTFDKRFEILNSRIVDNDGHISSISFYAFANCFYFLATPAKSFVLIYIVIVLNYLEKIDLL